MGFLAFTIGCGGGSGKPSSVSKKGEAPMPNIRNYQLPYQTVWKAVLEVVEFDFLMGIELQDQKKGFFSTEMIRDYQPFQKRRFRLSGTLIFDGQATIVKLYKHEEIMVNDQWQAIPSNSAMENQVLEKITKKLRSRAKK